MQIIIRFLLRIFEDIIVIVVLLFIKDFFTIFLIFICNVCFDFFAKVITIFESFIIRILFDNVLLRLRTLLIFRIKCVCEF